ncbi:MAG: prefoldin subunit beta [Candidatus Aenigmarchaeota archaeon]|nr:prefoldin subunit beta [Candidatus Aenigmarchaeota archaeon]
MASQQMQQLVNQAQVYQQQAQLYAAQKETLNMQMLEIEKALKELETSPEDKIYKIAGPILIKAGKEDVRKELQEKKDFLLLKIQTIDKSEKKAKEKLEEIKQKLTSPKDRPEAG